jgi:hypothetical protein
MIMTYEEINIAIAEVCGWTSIRYNSIHGKWMGTQPQEDRDAYHLPNYCNDLNAMHEAEATLDFEQAELFEDELCDVTFKNNDGLENPLPCRFSVCHATARQRAEAFIRTLGIFSYEQPMQKMAKPINKQCPHCGIICSPKHYSGWHGDKCKVAITIPSTQRKKVDG